MKRHLPLVAFLALTLIGGANPVAVRISNRELAPFWGAGLRFALASIILWLLVLATKPRLPTGSVLGRVVVYGAIQFGLSYALVYWGFVSIPGGLGQTIFGIVPLATVVSAAVHRQESLAWRTVVGSLLAIVGIGVMTRGAGSGFVPVAAVVAVVMGAGLVAEATVMARRLPPMHPNAVNAVAMTSGAALLLGASLAAGEIRALPTLAPTQAALAYLVLAGSIAVFSLFLIVIRHWPATSASYAFVVFPFWAVPLSARLDDERITSGFLIGGLLTLLGVVIGHKGVPTPSVDAGPAARAAHQDRIDGT